MDSGDTFGGAVVRTAWANTASLFNSRLQTSVLAVVSLAIGAAVKWLTLGLSGNLWVEGLAVFYGAATATVLVAARFLWQLYLAPSEILSAQIAPVLEAGSMFGPSRPPNYAIWKHRVHYNVNEFAALLVHIDPSAGQTTDYRSMLQLVMEHVQSGALGCLDFQGNPLQPGRIPDISFRVAKDDAIAWAKARGFHDAIKPLQH